MRIHRIYINTKIQQNVELIFNKDRSHYLKKVLRVKNNQQIRIFNGDSEFLSEVSNLERHSVSVIPIEKISKIITSKLDITIVQSISKGERMDYTIQKSTELGANSIQPIFSEYCDVKLDEKRLSKKIQHWNNVAISASEQSFRSTIPKILEPINLKQYADIQRTGFFLEPEEIRSVHDISKQKPQAFDIAIGPEGGWSQSDIQLLNQAGLQGIQFGQRILRTETVAPAILASVHTLWGDFS